jgi:chromosome partitioning protein
MRKIAIINQKGGVGKTTTTANLGAALARAGKKVLLIDLDPQGHLTLHLGIEHGPEQTTIYDVLTGGSPMAEALLRPRERLALVPADIDLAAAEAELVSVTGREVLLREAVAALAEPFDAMIIDCPPSLGVLTINALAASDEVIIPLQAHFFGLQGMSKLLDTVTLVRQRINPALVISGIALCMHEANTKHAAEVADDLGRFLESARGNGKPWSKATLYKTCIRRNIKLAESSSFGQTVFDYATKSNGAIDYANLAAEIFPGIDAKALSEDPSPPTTTAVENHAVVNPSINLGTQAPPRRQGVADAPRPPAQTTVTAMPSDAPVAKPLAARKPARPVETPRRAPSVTATPARPPRAVPTQPVHASGSVPAKTQGSDAPAAAQLEASSSPVPGPAQSTAPPTPSRPRRLVPARKPVPKPAAPTTLPERLDAGTTLPVSGSTDAVEPAKELARI